MKLHLGCGDKYIPGFKHLDLRDAPHIDYQCSIDRLEMISNESVNLIYACHVLEHFPRNKTELVLTEWYRVLKRGGVLRLGVPNFEAICAVYSKNKDLEQLMGLLYGGQDYEYNFHYRAFDYNSLETILSSIGFNEVRTYDWRDTEHSHIDDFSQAYIPHMEKENGTLMSLNIEAVK